jgi:hypothetical protein
MPLPSPILGRSLPHEPRHPALLEHQVEAVYQVFYLVDRRVPELLVGE